MRTQNNTGNARGRRRVALVTVVVSMLVAMALPLTGQETRIEVVGELISKPYIEITLNLMARFGVSVAREGWQAFTIPAASRYHSPGEIWVEGEVFERDVSLIRVGAEAHIEVSAFPGEHLMGRVDFVYPVMDMQSRTNRVRIALPNPGARLKPGMFATIFFDVVLAADRLAVPMEAVIVTGERNLVFVHDAEGMLTPREVVLGPQAGEYVQILSGLSEGEEIVAAANFLVDAESRLGTTGGMMPGMQHGAMEPDAAPDTSTGGHVHD